MPPNPVLVVPCNSRAAALQTAPFQPPTANRQPLTLALKTLLLQLVTPPPGFGAPSTTSSLSAGSSAAPTPSASRHTSMDVPPPDLAAAAAAARGAAAAKSSRGAAEEAGSGTATSTPLGAVPEGSLEHLLPSGDLLAAAEPEVSAGLRKGGGPGLLFRHLFAPCHMLAD